MIMLRNSAPITAPMNDPRPPSRLAPPSTAAAMLVSVKLNPDVGSPTLHLGGEEESTDRGAERGDEERSDEQEPDPNTAARRRLLVEPHRARRETTSGSVQPHVGARSRTRAITSNATGMKPNP